jgi:hypothetical protein
MALIRKAFWPTLQGPELVAEIRKKAKRYFEVAEQIEMVDMWREQYATYYMRKGTSNKQMSNTLMLGTRKNPEVRIQVPEMRSLIRQQLAFLLAEPISFQCVASTGEQRSVMASEVGEKAINYVYAERIKPSLIDLAENLIVYGAASSHLRWDEQQGDTVMEPYQTPVIDQMTGQPVPETSKDDQGNERIDPRTGQPVPLTDEQGQPVPKLMEAKRPGKSGAPYRDALDPTMHCYDPIMGGKAGWVGGFERTNLFVLAAKYPKFEEMILDQTSTDMFEAYRFSRYSLAYGHDEGDILALHWYYADSVEIPGGRHVLVLGDDCIDLGPCPLKAGRLPIRVLLNSKMTDNALSFADSAGIVPLEEALNRLRGAELNNFAYYGNQVRHREESTRVVAAEDLSGGTREMVSPRGVQTQPGMLNINPMPPGSAVLKEELIKALPRTTGFGDVSRGTVEDTTSGAHAAVFEAITARNLSLPQEQIVTHETEMANDTLDFMREFSNVEFIAEIAGKSGSPLARSFAPEDLGTLRRVIAKAVPDAMRGSLARIKLVELTKGIEDPREKSKAVQMILRGDDEYGKNDARQLNLIAIENERMLSQETDPTTGAPIIVSVSTTDNHYAHNQDHTAAFDEYRTQMSPDPMVIKAFTDHMNWHSKELENQDPVFCKTVGYPDPPILPGNNAFQFALRLKQAQDMINPPQLAPLEGGEPDSDDKAPSKGPMNHE